MLSGPAGRFSLSIPFKASPSWPQAKLHLDDLQKLLLFRQHKGLVPILASTVVRAIDFKHLICRRIVQCKVAGGVITGGWRPFRVPFDRGEANSALNNKGLGDERELRLTP